MRRLPFVGVALIVDDIGKGPRLAFRYPAADPRHATDFHRMRQLFRPKSVLCGQTLEVVIDDVRFISHPTEVGVE
ncbi:unnamed protein product, partial [Phaeothamnion confervicola]